jgi:ketosteroid isomerase-like protein
VNFTARYLGAFCLFMAVLFLFSTAEVAASGGVASTASPQMSCAVPEYRQFDFWVGDWDVFEDNGATKVARVRVDRILDGCVLREHYEDAGDLQGESFSIYDAGRRLWHQSWVTNRGQLLTIEGQRKDGKMILAGASRDSDGLETGVRATWKPLESGDVRETAVRSSDAGRTWKPWFDLLFRRHQVLESVGPDDAKAVAGLDEQFQAAVKANDDATIDKILSDDFVLTGSGKVFHRADLLAEAGSRSSIYEHQEESERTVRVWGNTAVVTAKLRIKGTHEGKPVDYTLWFSDTYVRAPLGWRYVFGQASLPLPKAP